MANPSEILWPLKYFRTYTEKTVLLYSVNKFIIPSKPQALALASEGRLNQAVEKLIKSLKTKGSEAVRPTFSVVASSSTFAYFSNQR